MTYGIHKQSDNSIHCREWAPNLDKLYLAGDFNDWDKRQFEFRNVGDDIWELVIPPDETGASRLTPGGDLRYFCVDKSGQEFDRISPWAKFVAQNDMLYFNESYEELSEYEWCHQPPRSSLRALYIYEAHVGICTPEPKVSSYMDFAESVIPRIAKLGYNTIQLMAVMEHAYYASFGYQVTSFFAPSSRFGHPDTLKYLIDTAHKHGMIVLLDLVHSHASTNTKDGLNSFDGSDSHFFHSGSRGTHSLWKSRIFDYTNKETLRFLLSNLEYWVSEFKFDGFRFDGVTSMLYNHHGINFTFSGGYSGYYNEHLNIGAVNYLMLANEYLHDKYPHLVTIAEDVSGMPALCRPVREGGVGFDYRLAMSTPDMWIRLLKDTTTDGEWDMGSIVHTLANRRWGEKSISYVESHDQALVGDKSIAHWLMDKDIYSNMSVLSELTPRVDRGLALHKMLRLLTFGLGGEGILTFMGNEFGHPEWLDFPREGNGESFHYCRRQYNLADDESLRYKFLERFDGGILALEKKHSWLDQGAGFVYLTHETDKVIVFERGGLCFVFNFHWESFVDYRTQVASPGKYSVMLNSDHGFYGGHGRVDEEVSCFSFTEVDKFYIKIYLPSRTCVVFAKVDQ